MKGDKIMDETVYYFLAGFYYPNHLVYDKYRNRPYIRSDMTAGKKFELNVPRGRRFPYVTRDKRFFWACRSTANVYALSKDGEYAILIDCQNPEIGTVRKVKLTEEQKSLIKQVIDSGKFYEWERK